MTFVARNKGINHLDAVRNDSLDIVESLILLYVLDLVD